jgi:hypothetical protein
MHTLQSDATHRTDSGTARCTVRRCLTRCGCCVEESASHQRTARQAARAAPAAGPSSGGAAHGARWSPTHRIAAPLHAAPAMTAYWPASAARRWTASRPRSRARAASKHAGLHGGDALVHVCERLRERRCLLALLAALGRLGQQQHAARRPLGQARRAQLLPGAGPPQRLRRSALDGAAPADCRGPAVQYTYAAQQCLFLAVKGWFLSRRVTVLQRGRQVASGHEPTHRVFSSTTGLTDAPRTSLEGT